MAKKVAMSTINARSIDIINTIRANASAQYQDKVPEITQDSEIPKVGEALYGYPVHANEFLSSLINQIAMIRIKSATFNNAYKELKKGYLEFGETVEEVFVAIAKAREFKRTIPDVKTAFHFMNWKVQYPITVQQEDLRRAFTSANGVTDLIAKIIDSVMTAAEYDEFLLFKYLIIKGIAKGKLYPVTFNPSDMKNSAKAFRGTSNKLEFMSNKYNIAGVTTNTKKADQYIFMDAAFNAEYDVDVLASAFNMDKATFMGKLKLIDDFTTFDNDRFDVIREESNMLEEVTADELALCANVKAVLTDAEWFQVYDNLTMMTETKVSSGVYWNYFYNVWKTIDTSPFSNAVAFFALQNNPIVAPATYIMDVADKITVGTTSILTLEPDSTTDETLTSQYAFVQTEDATEKGIAIHPYGSAIYTDDSKTKLTFKLLDETYEATSATGAELDVGDTVTFTKQ